MRAHLLFEQSGTFKKAFRYAGIEAFDYDIQNDFGETDFILDLFAEIEKAYAGQESTFDKIKTEDLCMAFFPCLYFCEASELAHRIHYDPYKGLPDAEKIRRIIARNRKRAEFFEKLAQLFAVAFEKKIRLIVENPYNAAHFLRLTKPFFPPALVDLDRHAHGDFFEKPTAYWMVNFAPQGVLVPLVAHSKRLVRAAKNAPKAGLCSTERSMISPEYARNFVDNIVLGKNKKPCQGELFS